MLHSGSLASAATDLAAQGLSVQNLALAKSLGDPIPETFGRPQTAVEKPVAPLRAAPPLEKRPAIMTDVVGPVLLKVSLPQLLFFFRQLATMLNAGMGVIQALDTLSRQTRDLILKPIVLELSANVQEGRLLSAGMQRYPEVFSPLMLGLVRAGEDGGMLDTTINQAANYIEQEIELRNLYRKVTFYPKLVVGASIVIVLATNYIIRGMLGKPGGLYSPLAEPATWIVLAPLIAGLFLFFRVGKANARLRYNMDKIVLGIPVIGITVHQLSMAKFGRAFAALYKGGVIVPKALKLSADACGNEYLRSQMYPAARQIEEGESITFAFGRTGAFSQTVLDMTNTGEQTGHLDEMLDKVADYYEDDAKVRSNQTAIFTGVFCMLLVAVYVGYIVYKFWSGHAGELQQEQQALEGFITGLAR